jgi:hypothetical protein
MVTRSAPVPVRSRARSPSAGAKRRATAKRPPGNPGGLFANRPPRCCDPAGTVFYGCGLE